MNSDGWVAFIVVLVGQAIIINLSQVLCGALNYNGNRPPTPTHFMISSSGVWLFPFLDAFSFD